MRRFAFITAFLALLASGAVVAETRPGSPGGPGSSALERPGKPARALGKEVHLEGKLRVVRGVSRPQPMLTDQKGKRWLLVGRLRRELVRLHGHTLSVSGTVQPKKLTLPTLNVTRYKIGEVSGRTPQVGRLVKKSKGLHLRQAERSLRIKAKGTFLKRLKKRVGCKIWIVGDLDGKTLKAFRYGLLDCRKRPPLKRKKETSK
jgi:hypothetical protein